MELEQFPLVAREKLEELRALLATLPQTPAGVRDRALLLIGNVLVLAFGIVHVQFGYTPLSLMGSFSGHDLAICVISFAAAVVMVSSMVLQARSLSTLDPTPAARPAQKNPTQR